MALDFFFHDQVSTKECAGREDRTRGRLHAERTRFGSSYRARLDGHEFDPHVLQHSFVEISTAILSLPLIQEGQLSVTGERMCTGKLHKKIAQEQCG